MACRAIPLAAGVVVIACSRGQRVASCSVPGCGKPHVALCDWPTKPGKTCDAKLCEQHRHPVGPDADYCPPHHKLHTAK
jgi:hypothetical protein